MRPLHALLDPVDLDRLRLVKIDVEGYEVEVLRGLAPILDAGYRPAILVEVHADFAPEASAYLTSFCAHYGLAATWIVDDEGLPYRLAPADRPLELHPLGSPPDLRAIARGRYTLILSGRSEATAG